MAFRMARTATILLAMLSALDFARIRLDKTEEPYIDARAFDHIATSAANSSDAASAVVGADVASLDDRGRLAGYNTDEDEGSEAASAGSDAAYASLASRGDNEPALDRAIAALDAAVDKRGACRALGDSAIEASLAKLDAIKIKLADMLGDSLAKREKLFVAAGRGDVDEVNDLVEHGVNVNSNVREWQHEDGWTGTPLQHAAKQGHREIVRILLEAGAEKDCPPADSRSPLWIAAEGGLGDSLGVMRVLLEAEASTASACMNGLLPLHMAASKGSEADVRLLLEFGANVDAMGVLSDQFDGSNRGSPLFYATRDAFNLNVVHALIEAGANPDLASSRGRTPLHNCAERDYAGMARLLLEAIDQDGTTADKDAIDEDGKTPLFVAAQAGSTEVARILIEAGARPCLGNNNGETPMTVTKDEEIRKMIEMIPKVVVTIAFLDDEVVVSSTEPPGGQKAQKEGVVGRMRRISRSLLGRSGINEVLRLPGSSTLEALLAEVAEKLRTDPPMLEVRLPSGDIASHADNEDMQKTLQDLLAENEA